MDINKEFCEYFFFFITDENLAVMFYQIIQNWNQWKISKSFLSFPITYKGFGKSLVNFSFIW
jgi:hypothetical protein